MANPSKRKGTDAEVRLLSHLKANGHPEAVRCPPAGTKDVGDLNCLYLGEDDSLADGRYPHIVIEVKSYKDIAAALREGVAELEVEKANAGTSHGVLVVKRPGKTDPGEWYAVRRVCDDPEIGDVL